MNTPSVLFQRAVSLQQGGRLVEAEALCRQLVKQQPGHAQGWHLLGHLRLQGGDAQDGLDSLRCALAADPGLHAVHLSLGNALLQLKRPAEAVPHYQHLLRQAPHDAAVHNNLGTALRELGQPQEALQVLDRALALKPDYARAHNNRGNALRDLQRLDEALQAYEQAVALDPQYVIALNNRAELLRQLGRTAEAAAGDPLSLGDHYMAQGQPVRALACYDQLLRLQPNDLAALNNRGVAQLQLRLLAEARQSFEQVLQHSPHDAGALNNLGNVLREQGLLNEALARYSAATEAAPEQAVGWSNRANLLFDLKRPADALPCLERLLALSPQYDYALGNRWHGQRLCCDWRDAEASTQAVLAGVRAGQRSIPPFALLSACDDPALHSACAQRYAQDRFPAQPPLWPHGRTAPPAAKLRIAYLSADFHEHATAYLMAGVFEQHDRSRFELIAWSYGPPSSDAMRQRLQASFDHFEDGSGLTDTQAAQRLHALGVHLAIDLKGYTGQSRPGILAHRPAPIQVSYLGYPGTLGAPYIDYVLADRHVLPAAQHPHYSEAVVSLPHSYQPTDAQRRIAEPTPSRTTLGLPEAGFVYGCFNNSYKLTPHFFSLWMRLLQQVPGSVLWLMGEPEEARLNLQAQAQAHGVDPGRLVFAPKLPQAEHLARLRQADLFLDTLPYNAHTTASDALWAGLPVLTCQGQAFAGRVAASLLHSVGLPELITHDLAGYEALALQLALQPQQLAAIRARLAAARAHSPLFDTRGYTRDLERAYLQMWAQHQAGQPAAGFALRVD